MRICDICKKKPSHYTTWTPKNGRTDMCIKCYDSWQKYQAKALREAYKEFIKNVEKESGDGEIH